MPLSDELLKPIPGANTAGDNLEYTAVYEKIAEARRQDDDAPQGEWLRERKAADWPLAIKLISEALAKRTKDLQLAAWLTEALTRRNGVSGLKDGLDLVRALLERFWDHVYPELEGGDADLRSKPLHWMANKLQQALHETPLTSSGLNYFQYTESRVIGYEAEAETSVAKAERRAEALAEGKVTAEVFDAAFESTPSAFYEELLATYDAVRDSLAALADLCDVRFGDDSPAFTRLRDAIDEARQIVVILAQKKREKAPSPEPEGQFADTATAPDAEIPSSRQAFVAADPDSGYAAAAVPARSLAPRLPIGEMVSRDLAVEHTVAAARFLRSEEPYSPVPYLILRGLRWGELRASGEPFDPELLQPPSSEMRQTLRSLSLEGNWPEVLETAEVAMGMPCGRAWLDIQRHVVRACEELGSAHNAIAAAVKSFLRSLLADLPTLPHVLLLDDTAAANPETLAWLGELAPAKSEPVAQPVIADPDEDDVAGEEGIVDAEELARRAAAAGKPEEGVEILARELARERSGRARFRRKIQLAQLCLAIGRETIAYPILSEIAQEIELRKLDEWEAREVIAHPLTLLFHCMRQADGDAGERQRLYDRICRLDPVQAMSCSI